MRRYLPLLVAIALTSCQGRIGDLEEASEESDPTADPAFDPAFNLPETQPQLLPFWVRLERVAGVLDRTTDDPLFELLRQNRLGLGDYDYASGVKPDRMWSPARISLWAKSLKPVCSSTEMHAMFPGLATVPADAVALASKAWGRSVATSELNFDAPSLAALEASARYEMVCLAILSSAEFVIQ